MPLRRLKRTSEPSLQRSAGDVRLFNLIPETSQAVDYFDPEKEISPKLWEQIYALLPDTLDELLSPENAFNNNYLMNLETIYKIFYLCPDLKAKLAQKIKDWPDFFHKLEENMAHNPFVLMHGILFFPEECEARRADLTQRLTAFNAAVGYSPDPSFSASFAPYLVDLWGGAPINERKLQAEIILKARALRLLSANENPLVESSQEMDLQFLKLFKPELIDPQILAQAVERLKNAFRKLQEKGHIEGVIDKAFLLMVLTAQHAAVDAHGLHITNPSRAEASLSGKTHEPPQNFNL